MQTSARELSSAQVRYATNMAKTCGESPIPSRREFVASLAAMSALASHSAVHANSANDASNSRDAANALDDVDPTISASTIAEAEKLMGITFTQSERDQIARTVSEHLELFSARARFGALDNQLAPATVFRVLLPGESSLPRVREKVAFFSRKQTNAPSSDDDLDWASVEQLSAWLHAGTVSSRTLVERSLARLKKSQDTLHCVITLVQEQALAEADERDAELKSGKSRGVLHGIPYGLKDLFDTAGIKTTWGGEPWRDRVPTTDATVVTRLRAAGAVLVAKTALGALAYGDIWFGGMCRNPWNPAQGSSGSSAGSASTVAAGCVPFAIGTETLGSIVSPCTRCGTTGLRPTFGRVARDGAMALCWSWDKIGPITRSVIDTGLVLEAINGASDGDASSVTMPFIAPRMPHARAMRLAYDPAWFEGASNASRQALDAARAVGAVLVEQSITPPTDPSILVVSLMSEAAAAFEEMTRSNSDDQLSWQADEAWPNSFRKTWFIPAIELVQAERVRRVFMQWMRSALRDCDALILPPFAGGMLTITNATGHPTLCLRAGFDEPAHPTSITLIGHPFDESTLISIGAAIEAHLDVATKRPATPWL